VASVYRKRQTWYLRVKDSTGRWGPGIASKARTKAEARRLAEDLERRAERIRFGLEAAPPADGGGTVAALMQWWLDTYSFRSPSHSRNLGSVRAHLLTGDLAPLLLVEVTPAKVEAFLQAKGADLSPGTVNHLRAYISRAFNAARRVGRYTGPNPTAEVRNRRIPRRAHDYLRASEVPGVMAALDPKWLPLFAAALYTGMRKGELLGLRKADVDLGAGLITVARSWDRDTTKGGHADTIPIAADLAPFLRAAIAASPSALVFPKADGSMMNEQVALESVLRRALGRAGIVEGYRHVCRARVNAAGKRDRTAPRCTHVEAAPDKALRRCPAHGDALWPVPVVRPIRFHDLRHTTASLLMQAGANPAAVQRILRHSNPRITTEVYGHLAPGYLRAEVDRLGFGLAEAAPVEVPVEVLPRVAASAVSAPLATRLLPEARTGKAEAGTFPETGTIPASLLAGCTGLEPVASGVTGQVHGVSIVTTARKGADRLRTPSPLPRSRPNGVTSFRIALLHPCCTAA